MNVISSQVRAIHPHQKYRKGISYKHPPQIIWKSSITSRPETADGRTTVDRDDLYLTNFIPSFFLSFTSNQERRSHSESMVGVICRHVQ